MSFDNSRFTFNPWNDYSGVVMEQGRVQLDSDWNEWLAEFSRRVRAGALDTFGRAAFPATTPNAFLITPSGASFTIGVGRMYVDGLLAENHGLPVPNSGGWIPPSVKASPTQPAWDPALDELVGQNAVSYDTQQPYYPNPPALPKSGGPFLIYLDVWTREVTFLEQPDLIDKAVGVDTTGRLQTVWQVKWLDLSGSSVSCSTKDSDIVAWSNLIQPSAGRLTTGVVQSSPPGPCCLTSNSGYTGMENQFYRVEIHQPGTPAVNPALPFTYPLPANTPTFKWSRDNASVATLVTGITTVKNSLNNSASQLTVQSMGRDQVLGFAPGNWIEILDDNLELNGLPGELHQIDSIDFTAKTITLDSTIKASFPNPSATHTRIQRWDQSGKIFESDGKTLWIDLGSNSSTGEIPVPPPGVALILENGITVSFDLNPSTGSLKTGNYWTFAARATDGTVENLVEAPPRGIHHHYARLSIFTLNPPASTDCRHRFPQACCDCDSCVTAHSHNDGGWTIQNAIDAVQAQGGGKVCLGPGVYNITATVNVEAAANIAICGHGLPLLQPVSSFTGSSIVLISGCIDIDVNGIAFAFGAGLPLVNQNPAVTGLAIQKSLFVRVDSCSFGLVTDAAPLSSAISFSNTAVMDCAIRGSLFANVTTGIRMSDTDSFLLAQMEIEDNQMFCLDSAVLLSGANNLFVSGIRFVRNFVQSMSGIVLLANGIGANIEDNTFQIAAASVEKAPLRAAVVCNFSQSRITNNDISGWSTLTGTASGNQGLAPGTYIWVVTAVDASGHEILITGLAGLTLVSSAAVTLAWTAVAEAATYNVYRSKANGETFFLDGSVPAGSDPTVSFNDTAADSSLATTAFPVPRNHGIVLGSDAGSIIFETQVIANRINGLLGTGIWATQTTVLVESIVAENQMLNLGGTGIAIPGIAIDLDVARNSLGFVLQLPWVEGQPQPAGIDIRFPFSANVSENQIENLGSLIATRHGLGAIAVVALGEARIAANRIVDVSLAVRAGIYAIALSRIDVSGNVVRRASIPPAQPDQTAWLALIAAALVVSIQGNLFDSFGGSRPVPGSQIPVPGTVDIAAGQCTFSNNQCFLDNPNPDPTKPAAGQDQTLVVAIIALSMIIMGNQVQGPNVPRSSPPLSMLLALITASDTNNPPLTVIGNITSSGITVVPGPMPAAMVPLNIPPV